MATLIIVCFTQLDAENPSLKGKTNLMVNILHLHKNHLHHLDEKLEQTSNLLAGLLEAKIWFSSKVTDAIKKKFQSVIHHHENIIKSAQHHCLAPSTLPHDLLDAIINHIGEVTEKKNLVPFIKFASDLFQFESSHLYALAMKEFTLILHIMMFSNTNLLDLFKFLPLRIHFNFISLFPSLQMSASQTSSQSDTQNHFKLFRRKGDGN